ncbi:hypothetical protein FQA39_LY08274 [Lamprigera yunnana]|nr:hypothetical protein FQA39_LY08274 [Lamprigera yunnana]
MSDIASLIKCQQALHETGWGLYHYFAISVACACSFAQAMAFSSIPYVIPLAICDTSISQNMILIADVCLSFGMAIGGFFLSSITDVTGRKCMIPTSLMIIFGSMFVCGFIHEPVMIVMCAFVLGSGLVANAHSAKIYLSEILPIEKRGSFLAFQDVFWTVGYIIATFCSYLLTLPIVEQRNKEIRLATWRIIFALLGVSSIVVACASALLLPSPRFLILLKQYPEALDTLKRMYAINNSKYSETYTSHQQDLYDCIDDFNLNSYSQATTCVEVATVDIWLTKMLQHGNEKDCHFNAVDILHLEDDLDKCVQNIPSYIYKNFCILSINILLGQLILIFVVDRFGRRVPILCGCIICAITSFTLRYVQNLQVFRLICASLLMMAYSIIDSTVNIVVVESYPTAFRGTAAGSTAFFAKFVGGFIKRFLEVPCQHSFTFMGTVMIAGAALSYFLPDLRKEPMVE